MKEVCAHNCQLRFSVENDLEEYRVNSLFEKEPETIEWINRFKENGGEMFFDIGANIGVYSLYSAYKHSGELSVFAFEPVANNYAALLKNLWANNFVSIKPFNIALSNRKHLAQLFLNDLRIGNSGAQIDMPINERGENYEPLKMESVLCISVDQLISEFGFPVPNYVKIDVDGHEWDILNGMVRTLSSSHLRSVLIEFNNQDQFVYWKERFAAFDLKLDHSYDDIPNHSGIRRQSKGSMARNYIFTRPGE